MVAIRSIFATSACHVSFPVFCRWPEDLGLPSHDSVSARNAAVGAGGIRTKRSSGILRGGISGVLREAERSCRSSAIGADVSECVDGELHSLKEGATEHADGYERVRESGGAPLHENNLIWRDPSGNAEGEDWGRLPRQHVSEATVLRLVEQVSRSIEHVNVDSGSGADTDAVSALTAEGAANVRVLLELGASETIVLFFFDRFSKLCAQRVGPYLVACANVLEDFGMDSSTLFVIVKKQNLTKRRLSSLVLNENGPKRLREFLVFLRDRAKVQNVKKVLEAQPELVGVTTPTLLERLITLEELGVLVNGQVIEKFPSMLLLNSVWVRGSMGALDQILGSKDVMRLVSNYPLLINVSGEKLLRRWDALEALVGDKAVVRKMLLTAPNILVAKEETVQKTWQNLAVYFGKDRALDAVQRCAILLRMNWNTIQPKIDYLSMKGFDSDSMIRIPGVLVYSLNLRMKPRLDALERRGGYKGLTLLAILGPSNAAFENTFEVDLGIGALS